MKKSIRIVIFCILLLSILSIDSFAYKQGPGVGVCLKREMLPKGTVYIDLLIPAKKLPEKPTFTELTALDGKIINLSKESEIVNYNEDGFISFSVYLSDDVSYGYLFDVGQFYIEFGQNMDIDSDIKKEYKNFKVACLDSDGNILTVSNTASAKGSGIILEFDYLSLSEKGLKTVYRINPFETVGIVCLAVITVTVIIVVVQRRSIKKG